MSFLDDKLAEQQGKPPVAKKSYRYGMVIYGVKPTYAIDIWKWVRSLGVQFAMKPDSLFCYVIEDRFNRGQKPRRIPHRPLLCELIGVGLLEGTSSSKNKNMRRPRLVAHLGGTMLENRRLKLESRGFRRTDKTPSPYIILKRDPTEEDVSAAMANFESLREQVPHLLIQGETWHDWY